MGILNRLWQKVWDFEESKKALEMGQEIAAAQERVRKEIAEKHKRLTETQQMAMKHGGPERVVSPNIYQAVSSPNQLAIHQLALQQQKMLMNQQISQAHQHLGISSTTSTTSGSLAMGAGVGISGTGSMSGIYTSSVYSWPVLGDSDRDVFFMSLKGIEEASMKKPEHNSPYDEDAMAIFDLRYFDPKKISLLGLTSFCMSNAVEVEPLIVLLEGHGMVVVEE